VAPPPVTKLTTPGGKPASTNSLPTNKAPKGDFSDVLKITYSHMSHPPSRCLEFGKDISRTAFPAARAGAIFHA
jgi:hypothetical protein